MTRYAQDTVLGFEEDFVDALSFLEPPAERLLEGAAQLSGDDRRDRVLAVPVPAAAASGSSAI